MLVQQFSFLKHIYMVPKIIMKTKVMNFHMIPISNYFLIILAPKRTMQANSLINFFNRKFWIWLAKICSFLTSMSCFTGKWAWLYLKSSGQTLTIGKKHWVNKTRVMFRETTHLTGTDGLQEDKQKLLNDRSEPQFVCVLTPVMNQPSLALQRVY